MTAKIRTLGPGSFKIVGTENGRDFSADLTKSQLNPSTSSDDPTTYLDGSEDVNTSTAWTFDATVGDDFSADGLSVWLFDHQGEKLAAEFIPNNDAEIKWTFDVTITPVAVGGDVKSKNTNDISLPATNVAHKTNTPTS